MDIFASNISLNNNQAKDFRVENLLTLPPSSSSYPGKLVFNSSQSIFYGYDGSSWLNLSNNNTSNANNPTIVIAAGVGLTGGGQISLNQSENSIITFNNSITKNSQLLNDSGYTSNTGTTTSSNSQTFTNKGGNISQWTNDSGYTTNAGTMTSFGVSAAVGGSSFNISNGETLSLVGGTNITASFNSSNESITFNNDITNNNQLTNTGTTTASNPQTFTNKGGNISQWANDSGYTANTGTTTEDNIQLFTNKSGSISQWVNDYSYIRGTGPSFQFIAADGSYNSNVVTNNTVNNYTKQQHFAIQTLTTGSNVEWNLENNQKAIIAHTEDMTLSNPTNLMSGATYILYLQHDSASRLFLFSSLYKFQGNNNPLLSSGGNALDIFTFECNGVYLLCTNIALGFSGVGSPGGGSGIGNNDPSPDDTEPPNNPSFFSATLGQDEVILTWSNGSDNVAVSHYIVQREKDNSGSWDILSISLNYPIQSSVDDSLFISGSSYKYRIKTVDTSGNESLNYKYASEPVVFYYL